MQAAAEWIVEHGLRVNADLGEATVMVTDRSGVILFVNPAFTSMTGYTREEALGKTPSMLRSDRQPQEFYGRLWSTIAAGRVWEGELVNRRKDGTFYTQATRISPISGEDGGIVGFAASNRDLSGWRAAEEARRFLAAVVESSADAIITYSTAGIILTWNRAAEKVFGYGAGDIIGRPLAVIVAPEQRSSTAERTRIITQGSEALHTDGEGVRKDGSRVKLEVTASSVRDADGEVMAISLILRDTTLQREAEQKLRHTEQRFRTVIHHAPVGIGVAGVDGRWLLVNPAFCKMLGYSEQEFLEQSWMDMTVADDLDISRETHRKLCETPVTTADYEKRYRRRDGGVVWVRLHLAVMQLDHAGTQCYLVQVEDITARRQIKVALKESEERFRRLYEDAPFGICISDLKGRWKTLNPSYCNMLGYTESELLALSWQGITVPDDRARSEIGLDELLQSPERIVEWEKCYRHREGHMLWAHLKLSLVRDTRGVPLYVLTQVEDITERRRTAEILRETTERANKLALEAAEASAAKSEFLANMSHEIRTPLNGVTGMLDLLLDTSLSVDQRRYAETAVSSGQSLLGLINDILDFSKIEARKLELEKVDFNLAMLIDDVSGSVAAQALNRDIELVLSVNPDVPAMLQGDPARLRQVVTNLLSNAIKFTASGEVELRVVLHQTVGQRVWLRFSVRDTGIGIPAEKLGLIFNEFTQVDVSTTRRFGGTGLGLAIARRLIELMDGEVGVNSCEGQGSEFWFVVPLELSGGGELSSCTPLAAQLQGARVLVAESNDTSRRMLMRCLSGWGMRVDAVQTRGLLMRRLRAAAMEGNAYALVVASLRLLGSGDDAADSALLTDSAWGATRILLLARLGEQPNVYRFPQLAEAAAVAKPVRPSDLAAGIHAALCGHGSAAVAGSLSPNDVHGSKTTHFHDLRALVAEDNPTNQQVALGLLKKLGVEADVVGNGRQALEALAAAHYDLVLMDMRMPEMDGVEAARRIRAGEAHVLNPRIPILAMTANIQQSDRELCRKAGMNGFISKPVSSLELRHAIEEGVPGAKHPPQTSPDAGEGHHVDFRVFDREDMQARMMADETLIGLVLAAFLEDLPQQLQALHESLERGDGSAAGRHAHSIKGAAANVGGEQLRRVALEMEKLADQGDLDAVRDEMDTLATAADALCQQIRHHAQMLQLGPVCGPGLVAL